MADNAIRTAAVPGEDVSVVYTMVLAVATHQMLCLGTMMQMEGFHPHLQHHHHQQNDGGECALDSMPTVHLHSCKDTKLFLKRRDNKTEMLRLFAI